MKLKRLLKQLPEIEWMEASTLTESNLAYLHSNPCCIASIESLNDSDKLKPEIDWFKHESNFLCFNKTNPFARKIRQWFTHRVIFAGAAPSVGMCTLDTIDAIRKADVCLHDTLFDTTILDYLPSKATAMHVGKRCKKHSVIQSEINKLTLNYTREGKRVLRLKGGDPGIFGRLCEETSNLLDHGLPFAVLPAISSLSVATTTTGMLLTRRNSHRGFTVLTPRCAGGTIGNLNPMEMNLPIILFMASHIVEETFEQLKKNGLSQNTPAAIIYDAGTPNQLIIQETIDTLPKRIKQLPKRTGLLYVGHEAGNELWLNTGLLKGAEIHIHPKTQMSIIDRIKELGGKPRIDKIHTPMTMDLLDTLIEKELIQQMKQCRR